LVAQQDYAAAIPGWYCIEALIGAEEADFPLLL
jgi:hypothetical protein